MMLTKSSLPRFLCPRCSQSTLHTALFYHPSLSFFSLLYLLHIVTFPSIHATAYKWIGFYADFFEMMLIYSSQC